MNILLDMLSRVDGQGGFMVWTAPKERQKWFDESTLLMACEIDKLLELSEQQLRASGPSDELGLLMRANLRLTEKGRKVLKDNQHH